MQGSRVGLGGIRFRRVWHGCVRLCVGRCRVGGSVLVDLMIDSRAGHQRMWDGGSRVGWFVLVELDVGSRADQSERGPG